MDLPGERALRTERASFLATVSSLTPEEFETGETLCAGWAPRDVLAHLIGIDDELTTYVRTFGRISTANQRIVAASRTRSRDELLARARRWAVEPAATTRLAAWQLLGDAAIHHQDVLRPLGRVRDIPEKARSAILRTGMLLGAPKLRRYRVEPTDGGRALGRGLTVRGTREALGMWLAGRRSYESELEFSV